MQKQKSTKKKNSKPNSNSQKDEKAEKELTQDDLLRLENEARLKLIESSKDTVEVADHLVDHILTKGATQMYD